MSFAGSFGDAIAEFASNAIIKFAAASALAPITFGASQAAFIADTVVEGAVLAGKNAKKVAKVVKKLEGFADDAESSRNILKSTTEGLDKGIRKYVQDVADVAGKNARDVKKVVAGKADPKILENVGKRADELKAARKQLPKDPALGEYAKMGYRDQFGSDNPMLDRIGQKFDKEFTIGGIETSVPKVPGLIADATVQATSDQTHREADAQAKQAEKDEKWDEHWERERTKARGSDGSTVSEAQPWRAEGTL